MKPHNDDSKRKVLDKTHKQQRHVVSILTNKLLSQFSFRNIKTWDDCYKLVGYDEKVRSSFSNRNEPVAINDLRAFCDRLKSDLEKRIEEEIEIYESRLSVEASPLSIKEIEQEQPKTNGVETVSKEKIECPISIISKELEEDQLTDSNNYGLPPSPNESVSLFWHQKKAASQILTKVITENKKAVLLVAGTGTGKTFITAAVDRRLKDMNFHADKTWGLTPYLSVSRNSILEQTKRVNKKYFNINHPVDTEVVNIESLRSRAGQLWIRSKMTIINGKEQEVWEWKPMLNPCVLYLDECQAVKNESSTQHKILVAYNDLKSPTTQIFISATPFARVSEARAFAIATGKDISNCGFPKGTKLSASTWNTYAAYIAQGDPTDYNEAAVDRLMDDLKDYIVHVKGVRWQFNSINKVEIIDFLSDSEREEYANAWNKYLEKKAKLEESITDNPLFQMWIEQSIFLAAAEHCKREIFAKRMVEDVKNGYAAVLAVKQKKTVISVVKILMEKYNIPRDQISLIWGGGQTQLSAKQKLKLKVKENEELFKEAGISMEDMMLDKVEDRILEDLPEHMRLGNQSLEERQREIDKFQSGKSLFAIFTFKAGGVGLSLHHTDEQVREKVRRKESGWAVEEDIPNIPTRPRKVTISTTWSPMELVQATGRCARLTSLSNTEQSLLFYRGTVEEDQAYVVTHKLKCLKKVVRSQESWMDLITKHQEAKDLAKKFVKELEEAPETETVIEEEEEEEEEE